MHVMKSRFALFRRGEVYYYEDTTTGKQTSLRTKDKAQGGHNHTRIYSQKRKRIASHLGDKSGGFDSASYSHSRIHAQGNGFGR